MLSKQFRSLCLSLQPKIIGLAVMAIAILFVGTGRAASPGALDLSFGNRGTAAFNNGNVSQSSKVVLIQPDGKVVLAGDIRTCVGATCTYDILVVRFNTNGTLDTGFGTNGAVVTDNAGQDEITYAAALQADGKILVAGGGLGTTPSQTNVLGFKLVRYLPNGTLDTSFGTGGIVYESFDDLGGTPRAMVIEPDGKILVAGTGGNSMLFVARFNTNGSLDTGFDADGRIASNAYNISNARLVRQSDGKIVIAGTSSPQGTFKLVRFNADGTLDTAFGTGGTATSAFADNFTPTIAVQTDDKILVSGTYNNSDLRTPPLRRFNADGSIDSGFVPNHGEVINGACISCTQRPTKILLQPDGKFYLVGSNARFTSVPRIIAVTRYLPSGQHDLSYGFRGSSQFRYTNNPMNNENTLFAVDDGAQQADGKVVVAATGNLPISNFGRLHLVAVRLNATVTAPSLRGDFDGDRKTDFAVFRPSSRFWYVLRSSDGSMFAERYGVAGDLLTPSDYNYDLKTDLSVYRASENVQYISASLPSGGGTGGGFYGQVSDIRVQEDYDGDGYTDLAVFSPSTGTWSVRPSSLNREPTLPPVPYDISFPFGISTDKPVPADYDGDGRADFAVFRPSTGDWYILRSSDGGVTSVNFGIGTDQLVPGDYDGDLKADIAVYRDGSWYILRSSDNGFVGIAWGLATDKAVAGDYDGDGKLDVAVFRPSEGAWYVLKSSDFSVISQLWGISEDTPIPFTFVR